MAVSLVVRRALGLGSGSVSDRLDRGWGYTTTQADARTGIARLGLTASDMTTYTGSSTIAAGTTLDKMLFTTNLDLRAGGITITNSLFQPTTNFASQLVAFSNRDTGAAPPAKNALIDCTLDGTLMTTSEASLVTAVQGLGDVIGCNIKHFGSGIATMWADGVDIDCTIESNRVSDMVSFGDPATTGNHCDGFTIRDYAAFGTPSRTCTVQYNWVDCVTDNASGACFIQAYSGDIANVTFTKNLWASNNWCVSLGDKSATIDYSTVVFNDDRMDVQGFGDLTNNGDAGYPTVNNCYRYNVSNPPTYQGIAV